MTPPITILMPQLTEQMEEAVIATWLVEPGELVSIGDELVELETDKATMAYTSEQSGHLEPLAREGDTVAVGAPIACLHLAPVSAETPRADSAPPTPEEVSPPPASVEVPATPLARRAADALGVALDAISGTGPRGRVLQNDVLLAAGQAPVSASAHTTSGPVAPSATAAQPRAAGSTATTRRDLTGIQRTIARRMAEANGTIPHFQVSRDVRVDAVIDARTALQEQLEGGVRAPSLNDFLVRASALALRDHELVNASFAGDHFDVHREIHVGIAVASDAGLLVATVTDADRRSLFSIATEARRLAAAVRAGSATPAELSGATFTVSNLGMFGMRSIVPVINPPQAAILGVGATREELALVDGEVATQHVVTLTLSADHRILNGADAAAYLNDVARFLHHPMLLMAS